MPAKLFGTKHSVSWCLFVSTGSWPVFCYEYPRWLITVHLARFFLVFFLVFGRCPFCLFINNFLSGIFFLAFRFSLFFFFFFGLQKEAVSSRIGLDPPPPRPLCCCCCCCCCGKHENEVVRFVVKVFSFFHTQLTFLVINTVDFAL